MSREEFPKRKLKGVNVPDTLVTVNDVDSYKLLDAPNIDWDEYLMKWTNLVYKFKSGGNVTPEEAQDNNKNDWYTPDGKFNNGEKPSWTNGVIKDSEQVLDMIDYLMYRVVNLDYFADNWNLRDSAKTSLLFVCYNSKFLTPTTNKEYLLASPRNAEYVNNYLKVKLTGNTLQVLLDVSQSDDNHTVLRSTGYEINRNDYANESQYTNAINEYKNLFGVEGTLPDTVFYILSNSRGKLSIENASEGVGSESDPTAYKVPPVNISNVDFYTELPYTQVESDDEKFYNPFELWIYGTDSWFYNLQEISNAILANTSSYNDIRSGINLDTYKIDPNYATFSFAIKQVANKVAGIQYGEIIQPISLNIKKNSISDKVSLIINGNTSNTEFTSIPFYNEILENNKYKLTFNIDTNPFGITTQNYKQFGLYPTFFIKDTSSDDSAIGTGEFTEFTSDGFNSFSNDFGTIMYENGDYWFEPPKENEFNYTVPTDGYKITIYCLLYYKNGTDSDGNNPRLRSLEPIFVKANIKLKSKEKNKIIFLANTSQRRLAYRWNDNTKSYVVKVLDIDSAVNNTSIFLDSSQVYYADDESIIDYAVKDIYFDKNNYNYKQNKAITIPNVLTNIASSVWSDDVKIEFYGVANQTSLNSNLREFDLSDTANPLCIIKEESETTPGTYVPVSTKNIIKERFYKLGEDSSGNNIYFDYVDDIDPTYYKLDTSNDLLTKDSNAAVNDEKYLDTSKLNSDAKTKIYRSLSNSTSNYQEYGTDTSNVKLSVLNDSKVSINTTTALFPDKNGLVSNNNNLTVTNGKINITNTQSGDNINYTGNIYDADNDYFYLVFRVYCEAGNEPNGGITYSACEAYYFLRVLRNTKSYSLVFKNNSTINYTIGEDNTYDYSMKLIARSPIYLNQLLTEDAIEQNSDILGKQYWYFYGSNKNESTSNTWNDNVIAIDNGYDYMDNTNPDNLVEKHRDYTDKYLYIYNDGDKLPVTNYNYSDKISQSNPNYIISQNDWYYDVHSNQLKNVSVNPIDNLNPLNTGAVLYIDKLIRLKDTTSIVERQGDTVDNNEHFTAVSSNSVNINLGVIIGNSDIYTRVKSSTIGTLLISKRNYDINLYKRTPNGSTTIYTELTSSNSSPITLNKETLSTNISNNSFINRNPLNDYVLASDEFSNKNKVMEAIDHIIVNNGGSLTLPSSDITTSIRLETGNLGTWYISSFPINYDSTKNVNVYTLDSENHHSQNYNHGIFYFCGINTTSIPYLIKFVISPDEQGIYAEKIISNYFIVSS